MKLKNEDQVFNFIDTNGRRSDILFALQVYLEELKKLEISNNNPWSSWPRTMNQFVFYEEALKRSPVFKKHDKYDEFKKFYNENVEFKERFDSLDESLKNDMKYKKQLESLDKDIEKRARNYTSNLNKLGLITSKREITPVGNDLLNPKLVKRDAFEKVLPISNINLIILRQVLKTRIYTKNGLNYYSPINFIMYFILKANKSLDVSEVVTLAQNLTPYNQLDVDKLIDIYINFGIEEAMSYVSNFSEISIVEDIPISKDKFYDLFSNRKSSGNIDVYYNFYKTVLKFRKNKTEESFNDLKKLFDNKKHKAMINKAFGFNKSIFKFKQSKQTVAEFLSLNKRNDFIYSKKFNTFFYNIFRKSKKFDKTSENVSETRRILEMTGMFMTDNNILSLLNKPLFNNDKIITSLKNEIFQNNVSEKDTWTSYEDTISNFHRSTNLMAIFSVNEEVVENHFNSMLDKYDVKAISSLEDTLSSKRDLDFKKVIHEKFPREKVFSLLKLFKDRDNDSKIQKNVTNETDIPTIFEYLVGLAWYYLSDDKSYNLANSFNLTLNSNFYPVGHAPGGDGDIIINYENYVLMIEVTLMNKHAQKRGEWEPVLRHSVNLSINSKEKPTTTLFVADELDANTINIWRAVASVPLESSQHSGVYTEGIVSIMPLKIDDLLNFDEDNKFSTDELIEKINESYSKERRKSFDFNWREKIING